MIVRGSVGFDEEIEEVVDLGFLMRVFEITVFRLFCLFLVLALELLSLQILGFKLIKASQEIHAELVCQAHEFVVQTLKFA